MIVYKIKVMIVEIGTGRSYDSLTSFQVFGKLMKQLFCDDYKVIKVFDFDVDQILVDVYRVRRFAFS